MCSDSYILDTLEVLSEINLTFNIYTYNTIISFAFFVCSLYAWQETPNKLTSMPIASPYKLHTVWNKLSEQFLVDWDASGNLADRSNLSKSADCKPSRHTNYARAMNALIPLPLALWRPSQLVSPLNRIMAKPPQHRAVYEPYEPVNRATILAVKSNRSS